MSTSNQRGKIYQLAKALELSRDQVHGYCVQWYGADPTTKDLTAGQASDMIQRFDRMIQEDPKISNPAQRKKIYKLGYLLDWKSPAIRKFIRRQTSGRVNDVNHLWFEEASKVILGMEQILREEGKGHLLR